jgi:Rod binding domain-containing protein
MPISSINAQVAKAIPPQIDPEKIASSKILTEQEKVGEMTRQFEAVLLRQVLNQAYKPAFKSTMMPDGGVTGSIYQDMMVNELADKISSARTLGMAQELERQFTRQNPNAKSHDSIKEISKPNSTTKKPDAPPVHPTKARL